MSKKFKVWLDSGANSQSSYNTEISASDLGMTDAEWDALSEEQKDDTMREVAFERSDWGFEEIE